MATYKLEVMGSRIKAIRTSKTLSLEQFCDTLREKKNTQITRQTLSKAEDNATSLPVETLRDICEVFDCTMDYLLGADPYKTKDIGFIHKYTGLSPKAIETMNTFEYRANKQNSALVNAIINYESLGFLSHSFDQYLIKCREYNDRKQTFQKAKEAYDSRMGSIEDSLEALFEDEFGPEERETVDKEKWIEAQKRNMREHPFSRHDFYKIEKEQLRKSEHEFIAEIAHFLDYVGGSEIDTKEESE